MVCPFALEEIQKADERSGRLFKLGPERAAERDVLLQCIAQRAHRAPPFAGQG